MQQRFIAIGTLIRLGRYTHWLTLSRIIDANC
jgi:hypothetical protein